MWIFIRQSQDQVGKTKSWAKNMSFFLNQTPNIGLCWGIKTDYILALKVCFFFIPQVFLTEPDSPEFVLIWDNTGNGKNDMFFAQDFVLPTWSKLYQINIHSHG